MKSTWYKIKKRQNVSFMFIRQKINLVLNVMKVFLEYMELLTRIKQSRITDIQEETGCYRKCRIFQYSYEIEQKNLNWAAKWTAEVFIQPKSSILEKTQEYYSFGINNLMGAYKYYVIRDGVGGG